MPSTREGDQGLHVDRRVPITWLAGALGLVAIQAIVMWSNQQQIGKDVGNMFKAQDSIATDVKQIRSDVQVISIEAVKTSIKIEELQRRVSAIEAAQTSGKK